MWRTYQKEAVGAVSAVTHARFKNQMAVKKMLYEKTFVKEVLFMHRLRHDNLVEVCWFCYEPMAYIMEYSVSDFSPFGADKKCSSLSAFLEFVDTFDCEDFADKAFQKIVLDVASTDFFLHSKGVVH